LHDWRSAQDIDRAALGEGCYEQRTASLDQWGGASERKVLRQRGLRDA
jgi:hypothetical protein